MSGLLYRPDMDDVRKRLTTWWHGGDIGRPVFRLYAPRPEPLDPPAPMPEPEGWTGRYSSANFDYRVYLAHRDCANTYFLAEAIPNAPPEMAPGALALFLGCHGTEYQDTVWCEPCITVPEETEFEIRPDNFYWDFCCRLARELKRLGEGKWLVEIPDLVEGLDILASMRGSQELLMDFYERPEWIHACMRQITDRFFQAYDVLYDIARDETGGSLFWQWAPGRMAKMQCDFSAMIGPDMFGEFMVPVLKEITERVQYSLYHWDGPGALCHLDHLLSLPRLGIIQWVPGAGDEPSPSKKWWPYYHKIFDAGKKLYIGIDGGVETLRDLKKEFGPKLNQAMFWHTTKTLKEAEEILAVAEE